MEREMIGCPSLFPFTRRRLSTCQNAPPAFHLPKRAAAGQLTDPRSVDGFEYSGIENHDHIPGRVYSATDKAIS
jgi:hypothetical protein